MTSRLQGGRGTTGEQGDDATGFDALKCLGRSQKALQFQRVNDRNDRDLLRKVGGRVPDSWDQFFSLADRFKAAGIVPLSVINFS